MFINRPEIIIFAKETTEIKWPQGKSRLYYESLGYKGEHKKMFRVETKHIHPGSATKVMFICPICGKTRLSQMYHISKSGHSMCSGCAGIKWLVGEKFGRLVVKSFSHKDEENNNAIWDCVCSCGVPVKVATNTLISGRKTSCGCVGREWVREMGRRNRMDLTGTTFGKLHVLKSIGSDKKQSQRWLCVCECGNYSTPTTNMLTSGGSQSCGCGMPRGENHHNHNPALTDKQRSTDRDRTTAPEYVAWRRSVFSRNKRQCVLCKSKKNLVVHHLNGWKHFPDERYSTHNGIIICQECHYDFHVTYMGSYKKKCTKRSFLSWYNTKVLLMR